MRISVYGIMLMLTLATGSCSGQKGIPSGQGGKSTDTLLIAEHQKTYTLDAQHPQIAISVPVVAAKTGAGARYFLTLRNLKLHEAPDGAYEIYLSAAQLPSAASAGDAGGFVTVLDTY